MIKYMLMYIVQDLQLNRFEIDPHWSGCPGNRRRTVGRASGDQRTGGPCYMCESTSDDDCAARVPHFGLSIIGLISANLSPIENLKLPGKAKDRLAELLEQVKK